jgi:hypothetical protein
MLLLLLQASRSGSNALSIAEQLLQALQDKTESADAPAGEGEPND